MADLIQDALGHPASIASADPMTLVELMFFAYRDFTGEPDVILAEYGLGRAHHRVLHFVRRHPGLRVTELLAILKITKQSLGRVLSPLITDGWIESRRDADDQRARQLLLTEKGHRLAERLAAQQLARMARALPDSDGHDAAKTAEACVRNFLFAMISPDEREQVAALLQPAATAQPPPERALQTKSNR
jgi:DNA-binding MarR family transcriptional regulator